MTTKVIVEVERWPAELGHELRRTGRQLWLAGLGAARTLEERGRELFADLVDRGERLELPDLEGRLRAGGKKVRDFGRRAESRLAEATSRTLERFGVPSRADVELLGERIEELTRKVDRLKS